MPLTMINIDNPLLTIDNENKKHSYYPIAFPLYPLIMINMNYGLTAGISAGISAMGNKFMGYEMVTMDHWIVIMGNHTYQSYHSIYNDPICLYIYICMSWKASSFIHSYHGKEI